MRPLVLNGRFLGRPVTGVDRFALELTRALRAGLAARDAGDVAVLVPAGTHADPDTLAALGTPPPVIAPAGRGGGHRWEQATLARARPDAWLLDLCNTGPVLRRRQALVIHDAQVALHPESYSRAFRWWYRTLQGIASRRAAAVFTVSHFSRNALERFGIVPAGRVHVLRSGVDHMDRLTPDAAVLARNGLRPGGYLLAIGSLARHKNLPMLVDAFLAAGLPDLPLVIAGGGNSRVFQDAGLPQGANLRYTGRVDDGELKALYAGALAFACPSLTEGFGLTPLEAMRTGCPVVATTGGAVPEICGDAALYADPHDAGAWTRALQEIAGDAGLRDELAAKARARAATFRWEDTARQVLDTLAALD
jgi:glycosyltransferase involved in cell wall biosynthesis